MIKCIDIGKGIGYTVFVPSEREGENRRIGMDILELKKILENHKLWLKTKGKTYKVKLPQSDYALYVTYNNNADGAH